METDAELLGAQLEGLLRLFSERHPGLCVTSLRPCWVMGPTFQDRVTRHFSGPIVTTLKPLVSKDASIAAYAPTNTVILTESASNIRRLIGILESIDVDTYREELAVLRIEYADAATLASQISQIFAAETSAATKA